MCMGQYWDVNSYEHEVNGPCVGSVSDRLPEVMEDSSPSRRSIKANEFLMVSATSVRCLESFIQVMEISKQSAAIRHVRLAMVTEKLD